MEAKLWTLQKKQFNEILNIPGRIFTVTQDIVELPNGKTSMRDLVFIQEQ